MLSKMAGAVALSGLAASVAGADTTFRVVHMNDFHGRVEGMSESESSDCKFPKNCDGGWPRIFTAARRMVDEAGSVPVIFVEDGDQFMGTTWSSYYKGEEVRAFLGRLCSKKEDGGAGFAACVGTLGNHEFDFKNPTLVAHLKEIKNITMVSSNIVDECTAEDEKVGPYLKKTHFVTLPGVGGAVGAKVGFVGYTSLETALTSSASPCTKFVTEETALPSAIKSLADEGVNIVVAAGHSGYARDKEIASAVAGLDLIVSGHSHTFLWMKDVLNPALSGNPNKVTFVKGEYPTLSAAVPIVQAFHGGRYLGNIEVTFNDAGVLTSHRPLQVLVAYNSTFAQYNYTDDAIAKSLVEKMSGPLSVYSQSPAGTVDGLLDGTRSIVRSEETNLGNLICDAMMDHANTKPKFVNSPNKVNLCLHNAGGIRASLGQRVGVKSEITRSEILTVLPFNNVLAVVEVTGLMVWNMVEHATARVELTEAGEFGQYGKGFRVWYSRARKPACGFAASGNYTFKNACTSDNTVFSRVSKIELNGVPVPKDASKTYNLVTVDFLTRGQDGYGMLTNGTTSISNGEPIDEILQKRMLELNATSNGAVTYLQDCRIVNEEKPSIACQYLGVATPVPTTPPTLKGTTLIDVTGDAQAATPAVIISAAALALAALL